MAQNFDAFVTVVAKRTGEKQDVPREWMEHRKFRHDFEYPPSTRDELDLDETFAGELVDPEAAALEAELLGKAPEGDEQPPTFEDPILGVSLTAEEAAHVAAPSQLDAPSDGEPAAAEESTPAEEPTPTTKRGRRKNAAAAHQTDTSSDQPTDADEPTPADETDPTSPAGSIAPTIESPSSGEEE